MNASTHLDVELVDLLEDAVTLQQKVHRLTYEVTLTTLQDYTFAVFAVRPELFHLALAKELDHDITFECSGRAQRRH
jgi:hypothetical protein